MRIKPYPVSIVRLGICVVLVPVPSMAGSQPWTFTSAPGILQWYGLTTSADGNIVLATSGLGQIYISTNGGLQWTGTTVGYLNDLNWAVSIATSADGSTSILNSIGGQVLVSTNRGYAWQFAQTGSSVACSADGSRMVVATGGGIYLSTNSGSAWYPTTARAANWASVLCSAAGTKLLASDGAGTLYISLDSGETWSSNSMPSATFVASSADGNTLIAAKASPATGSGELYVSTNSGALWNLSPTAPNLVWEGVASSADGTRLVAIPYAAPVYTSSDTGATWTSNAVPNLNWWAVCSSADGHKLFAAGSGSLTNSGVWLSQTAPTPALEITGSASAVLISWLIPSTHFVLQQSTNLEASFWQDVTNQPALNYSNLNYQVTLPRPEGTIFYRLIAR